MHEAGLAATVASAIRSARVKGGRLRLIVAGDHGDPDAFDAALQQHLAAELDAVDGPPIEIVHEPQERLCAACATSFPALRPDDACPACGGPGLPTPSRERVELEWLAAPPPEIGATTAGPPEDR